MGVGGWWEGGGVWGVEVGCGGDGGGGEGGGGGWGGGGGGEGGVGGGGGRGGRGESTWDGGIGTASYSYLGGISHESRSGKFNNWRRNQPPRANVTHGL